MTDEKIIAEKLDVNVAFEQAKWTKEDLDRWATEEKKRINTLTLEKEVASLRQQQQEAHDAFEPMIQEKLEQLYLIKNS